MKKLALLLSVFVVAALPATAQTEAQFLETSPLSLVTDEQTFELTVELADEPEELRTGLMFRDPLPESTGMLFNFGFDREANMIMRNVTFALDMVFFDAEGEILAIVQSAQPGSPRIINPGLNVRGVLELNAGAVEAYGLEIGDQIEHSMFDEAPLDGEGAE